MSEQALIPANIQVPAYLQVSDKQLQEQAASLITQGESVPKLSIRGSRFTFVKDGKSMPVNSLQLDVIVLAADPVIGLAKVYYEGEYVAGDTDTPDCMSSNGVVPEPRAAKKQALACASCPKNAWGSAKSRSGADIKACKDVKNLLIVPPSLEGIQQSPLWRLQVPAASLKDLSNYGSELNRHHLPMYGLVTRLSFDPDSEFPKLKFVGVRLLEQAEAEAARARLDSEEVQKALHYPPETPPATSALPVNVVAPPAIPEAPAAVTAPAGDGFPSMEEGTKTHEEPSALPPVSSPTQESLGFPPPATESAQEEPSSSANTSNMNPGMIDANGVTFDPSVHGMSGGVPKKKADGTFAKKRGVTDEDYYRLVFEAKQGQAKAPDTAAAALPPGNVGGSTPTQEAVQTTPVAGEGNIQDLLSQWGNT